MNHRILRAILLGLVSSASLAACAPNPADDVPAAVDPAAVDSAAQAPTEAAPVEAATEAVADPAAAGARPVGEFPLTGLVQWAKNTEDALRLCLAAEARLPPYPGAPMLSDILRSDLRRVS